MSLRPMFEANKERWAHIAVVGKDSEMGGKVTAVHDHWVEIRGPDTTFYIPYAHISSAYFSQPLDQDPAGQLG